LETFFQLTNLICQQWYIEKFQQFTNMVDPSSLEMFSADTARLRRIRQECEELQVEEQDAIGAEPVQQNPWMQYAAMAAGNGDAELPDGLNPDLDPNIDWVEIRKTPPNLIDSANNHLNTLRATLTDIVRPIVDVDSASLNTRQRLAFETVMGHIRNEGSIGKCMLILGGPGMGKGHVVKAISRRVAEHFDNDNAVLRLARTGTAAFVIGRATVHSALRLPADSFDTTFLVPSLTLHPL
jgi:AAA domain